MPGVENRSPVGGAEVLAVLKVTDYLTFAGTRQRRLPPFELLKKEQKRAKSKTTSFQAPHLGAPHARLAAPLDHGFVPELPRTQAAAPRVPALRQI